MSHSAAPRYSPTAPDRSTIDAMHGALLLQFGVNWCGHCVAAESAVAQALQDAPDLQRLCIEDGAGRPLGRSFNVKLWPTLVLLRDGQELARLVRPTQVRPVQDFLKLSTAARPPESV